MPRAALFLCVGLASAQMYQFVTTRQSQAAHRANCESMGKTLARPQTLQESEDLGDYLVSAGGHHAWIGGSDQDVEGTWVYSDGTPVVNSVSASANGHDLAASSSTENCIVFYGSSEVGTLWYNNGFWLAMDCSTAAPGLCQENLTPRPPSPPPPKYTFVSALQTQPDARADCESMGMTLARPQTRNESIDIGTFMLPTGHNHAWIGGSDEDVEGTWVYSDGTPVVNSITTSVNGWDLLAHAANADCITIYSGTGIGDWWSHECTLEMGAVCEYHAVTYPPPPAPPPPGYYPDLYVNKTKMYMHAVQTNDARVSNALETWGLDTPFGIHQFDELMTLKSAAWMTESSMAHQLPYSFHGMEQSYGGALNPDRSTCLSARSDGTLWGSAHCLCLWASPASGAEWQGVFLGIFGDLMALGDVLQPYWPGGISGGTYSTSMMDALVDSFHADLNAVVAPIRNRTSIGAHIEDRAMADILIACIAFVTSTFSTSDMFSGTAELLAGVDKELMFHKNASICDPGMYVLRQSLLVGSPDVPEDVAAENLVIQNLYNAVTSNSPDSHDPNMKWALAIKRTFYNPMLAGGGPNGDYTTDSPPMVILWQCSQQSTPLPHPAMAGAEASACRLLPLMSAAEMAAFDIAGYLPAAPAHPPPSPPSLPPPPPSPPAPPPPGYYPDLYVNKTKMYMHAVQTNDARVSNALETWGLDTPFGIHQFDELMTLKSAAWMTESSMAHQLPYSFHGMEQSYGGALNPDRSTCLSARSDGTLWGSAHCLCLWASPASGAEWQGVFLGIFGDLMALGDVLQPYWPGGISGGTYSTSMMDALVDSFHADLNAVVAPIRNRTSIGAHIEDRAMADILIACIAFVTSTFSTSDMFSGTAELLAGVDKELMFHKNASICDPGMYVLRQSLLVGSPDVPEDVAAENLVIQNLYNAVTSNSPDSHDPNMKWALAIKRTFYNPMLAGGGPNGDYTTDSPPMVILWQCSQQSTPLPHPAMAGAEASACRLLPLMSAAEMAAFDIAGYLPAAPAHPPPSPPSLPPPPPPNGLHMHQFLATEKAVRYFAESRTRNDSYYAQQSRASGMVRLDYGLGAYRISSDPEPALNFRFAHDLGVWSTQVDLTYFIASKWPIYGAAYAIRAPYEVQPDPSLQTMVTVAQTTDDILDALAANMNGVVQPLKDAFPTWDYRALADLVVAGYLFSQIRLFHADAVEGSMSLYAASFAPNDQITQSGDFQLTQTVDVSTPAAADALAASIARYPPSGVSHWSVSIDYVKLSQGTTGNVSVGAPVTVVLAQWKAGSAPGPHPAILTPGSVLSIFDPANLQLPLPVASPAAPPPPPPSPPAALTTFAAGGPTNWCDLYNETTYELLVSEDSLGHFAMFNENVGGVEVKYSNFFWSQFRSSVPYAPNVLTNCPGTTSLMFALTGVLDNSYVTTKCAPSYFRRVVAAYESVFSYERALGYNGNEAGSTMAMMYANTLSPGFSNVTDINAKITAAELLATTDNPMDPAVTGYTRVAGDTIGLGIDTCNQVMAEAMSLRSLMDPQPWASFVGLQMVHWAMVLSKTTDRQCSFQVTDPIDCQSAGLANGRELQGEEVYVWGSSTGSTWDDRYFDWGVKNCLFGFVGQDLSINFRLAHHVAVDALTPPAPPAPPSLPPHPPSSPRPTITMQLTATGEVSDYDAGKKAEIATAVAALITGATAADVSVSVTAGSVIIDVTVTVPSSSTTGTVVSELSGSLSNPEAATAALGVTVEAVTLPPPEEVAGSQGDPHLYFAHGGTADFRGKNNTNYNLLSAPGYSFASRTVDSTFLLPKPRLVHGSFFVNASWRVRGTSGREISVEADAHRPGFVVRDASDGRIVVNHTLIWTTWWHEGIRVMHKQSTILVRANGWEVNATRHPIYNPVEGPSHWRYDFAVRPLDGETGLENLHGKASATCFPHGIIGQHWDGDKLGAYGARDNYDTTVVYTKAMAEGAIEGSASDYAVDGHIDSYKFGRFYKDSTRACPPRDTSKLKLFAYATANKIASTSSDDEEGQTARRRS